MKRWLGLVLVLAVASALAARSDRRIGPGADRAAWNVLILTLDTTRADRLGAYGFAADATVTGSTIPAAFAGAVSVIASPNNIFGPIVTCAASDHQLNFTPTAAATSRRRF